MTYREKLEKEHPECIGPEYYGGCAGCPKHYGYGPERFGTCPYGRANDKNCTACWNREIPAESEEFGPGKSYAEFTDGHKEEITFYERADAGGSILFATCSGVYLFTTGIETLILDSMSSRLKFQHDQFYRVRYEPMKTEPIMTKIENIKFIAIDTRVKHEYCITLKDGRNVAGSVWIERDASVEKIRGMVMDDAVAMITTETTDA